MRSCIAVALLAITFICGPVAAETIVFDVRGPRPQISVNLNGAQPVTAVFDTGAPVAVVSPWFARRVDPTFDIDAGGPHDQRLLVRGLRSGDVMIPEFRASVSPLPNPTIAMVLSPNVFAGSIVTIDFDARELSLAPRNAESMPPGPGQPYAAAPIAMPRIPVRIGSIDIDARLDTGSSLGLLLPMRFADQVPLRAPLEPAGSAQAFGRSMPLYRAQISGAVEIGPILLQDPMVRFSDAVREPNIGIQELAGVKLVMDPERQRSWLLPN